MRQDTMEMTARYSFEITEVLRIASKIPVSFGDAIVWMRS